MGNDQFFELFIGPRVVKKDYHGKTKGEIPVYSADMETPFAWDNTSNIEDWSHDFVLWGIDSNLFRFRVMPKGTKFRNTDHCGCARILDAQIDASYLHHRLIAFAVSSTLDRQLRPSLRTMRKVAIRFPVAVDKRGKPLSKSPNKITSDGPSTIPLLDLKVQQQIADFYDTFDSVKRELAERMKRLAELELEPLRIGASITVVITWGSHDSSIWEGCYRRGWSCCV